MREFVSILFLAGVAGLAVMPIFAAPGEDPGQARKQEAESVGLPAPMAPGSAAPSMPPSPQIEFAGYTWLIREEDSPAGPQNNVFGLGAVTLGSDKSLRLRIVPSDGHWFAAELYLQKSLGYGTYTFRVRTAPADLDSGVVLGLFTYSPQKAYYHREIDIEFSAWGVPGAEPKGQYVLQPYTRQGNLHLFDLPEDGGRASYSFRWQPGRIEFLSWSGYGSRPAQPGYASVPDGAAQGQAVVLAHWLYEDSTRVPKPGSEGVHINLYLAHGEVPPAGDGAVEVIIDGFEFAPEPR